MKKIIAILSSVIILFNLFGWYLLFNYSKDSNYNSIRKDKFKDKKLETLALKKSELKHAGIRFIKHDEFKFNGEMYDIVEKYEKGDSLYFICYHDKKEDKLITWIKKSTEKNERDNNFNLIKLNILVLSQTYLTTEDITCRRFSPAIQLLTNELTNVYKSHIVEIPKPPPRIFN